MKLLGISIIMLIAFSCSATNVFESQLNDYEMPIGYIHDTREINCHKFDSLIVNLKNNPLDSVLTVSLKHRHVQYWVFYMIKDTKWNIQLGENVLEKSFAEFFMESFHEETKRTGCYAISNKVASNSINSLDITIDTCRTNADYRQQMSDLLGFLRINKTGYPSETNMHVITRLTRGGKVITEKTYSVKRNQPYLPLPDKIDDHFSDYLMSNMVESLSLCTKECIEKIVDDVNISIIFNHFNR